MKCEIDHGARMNDWPLTTGVGLVDLSPGNSFIRRCLNSSGCSGTASVKGLDGGSQARHKGPTPTTSLNMIVELPQFFSSNLANSWKIRSSLPDRVEFGCVFTAPQSG